MIEGFEEFTENIDDGDISAINLIAKGLRARVGKKKAINNAAMRDGLYNHSGIKINDAKLRRYIQYIRAHRLVSMLCASKKGYWVAESKEEWIIYREGFRQRMRSMSFTLACMDFDEVENNVLHKP